MRAADQPEVRLLIVHGAPEQRLAAAAGDLARHVLLPQHRAVVRIDRPDEPLFLRRDEDVASVRRRCQRRGGGEVPVGPGGGGTVLGGVRRAASAPPGPAPARAWRRSTAAWKDAARDRLRTPVV